MKRFFSLFLAAVLFMAPLHITVSAAEIDATESVSVQPRLNKTITISLANAWTTFHNESNWFIANLTITNTANSSYPLSVRVASAESGNVITAEVTLQPGESAHFSGLPGGGYYIQGKTTDGLAHTYEIHVEDQF